MTEECKKRPRILLVDDDPSMIILVESMLERWGYEIEKAESPFAAISIASASPFDLVLMDVDLNDQLDGIAVAEILRRRFDIPAIYMTAYADDMLLDRARQTRPYGYLVKPVQRLELRATIEMALSRLELDRQVQENEKLYRAMFENNEAVKLLLDPESGAIVDANPAACRFYGYAPEVLKRMKITDINLLCPEKTVELMELTRTGKKKCHEFRHRISSGEIRDVEVHSGPVKWRGKTLLLSIIHDITQGNQTRKKLVQALQVTGRQARETEALLEATRSVLENHDFQVTARRIFDICSSIIGATAGYVALLSKDGMENKVLFLESGGRPCSVNPDLPMPIRGLREIAYSSGEAVYDNDFWNSRWKKFMPGGHVPLDNVLFAPLKNRDAVVGIMGFANKPEPFTQADARLAAGFAEFASIALLNSTIMESLESAKESAEAAAKVKSIFLANMSHELRTPLNGILGYSQILQNDPALDEKQLRAVETIRKSGEHLLTLISDILDLSKIEAGKIELAPSPIHLKSFMEGICSIIRVNAREKGLEFRFESEGDIPQGVLADEVRLRQILLNLLSNAVKYTRQGRVLLKIRQAGKWLRFEVADTGIGIAADKISDLFQPFGQVHDSSYRAEGTGLGLSICRQLVDLMGGELQLESEPGQGSRFILDVRFPRTSLAEASEEKAEGRITGYDGPRKKVMCVDDVADNRAFLRDLLKPVGFEIIEASDGLEALELLDHPDHGGEKRPHMILMDLVMPRMDGEEAIGRIRKREEGRDFFIIAISADGAGSGSSNPGSGYDLFLRKPVDTDALFKGIEKGLGLQWITAEKMAFPAHSSWETGIENEKELIPPDRWELEKLYSMASIGAIGDIRKMAKQGKSRQGEDLLFWETIEGLSMVFNLPKIKDLIQRYREAG